MRRILAVYDEDPVYAARFADVVNGKEKIPFEAVAFSSVEKLDRFAGKYPVELLLLGEGAENGEAERITATQRVILTGTKKVPQEGKYPCVYKFQSVDAILREIMAFCGEQTEACVEISAGKAAKVIGVFSPLGRCRKTSLAIVLGKLMAQDCRTLYLNLEANSGLSFLTGTEYHRGMSDLLYYWKMGNYNGMRLSSAVYSMGELDYVPPVRYPEDLEQAGAESLAALIETIAKENDYEILVIDAGDFRSAVLPVLAICSVVYMPVLEDRVSAAKLQEFEMYLTKTDNEVLMEKIKRLKLPEPVGFMGKDNYIDQLLWGELGDYVRQFLRGGKADCGE